MVTSSSHGQKNKIERDTGPSLLKDGVCILTLLEQMLYMHVNESGLFSRTGSLPTLMRGAPEAGMTLKPGTSPAPVPVCTPRADSKARFPSHFQGGFGLGVTRYFRGVAGSERLME